MSVKLYSAYGEKQVDMSLQASSGGHGNPYLKVASVNEIPPGSVNLLPPEEQQRYGQYKNKNAADLFLLGRILLRNILSENYLLPFDVDIKTDTDGKPYIAQQPPYFSISHSNEKAAVVFAEKPVGVDIEKFVKHSRETLLAMGEKVFSSKEMLILENAANVRECFTKMWVIKEAFVKAVGNGLAYSSGIDLSAAMEKIVNSMGAATAIDGYKCFIERIFDDYFLSVTVKL